MWPVCNMAWRIGDILDVDEQIAWTRDAGFDGIAFHASAGAPGKWQGVDFATADAGRRAELRQWVAQFTMAEIHAPFSLAITDDLLDARVRDLEPVLDFAGDVGASVVTVHAAVPPNAGHWREALAPLDAAAGRIGVAVGLELTEGFRSVAEWDLLHVGVTLDVGHMYLNEARALQPYACIGDVVREIGSRLVHLHVHDYDGAHDHIALGSGRVDLDGVLAALQEIGYARGMTLELNPDHVSPQGMQGCLAWLRDRALKRP